MDIGIHNIADSQPKNAAQSCGLRSGHTLAVVVPLCSVPLVVYPIEVALPGLGVVKKSFVAILAGVLFAGHDWSCPQHASQ